MDIAAIREAFPALSQKVYGRGLIYLDNAATTQMPECVIQEMREYISCSHGGAHRSVHYLSREATQRYEGARDAVASFLNASREEIVFTSGTTDAVNLAARAMERFVGPGDVILATRMEHHSNYVPWMELCRRRGAVFRAVPLDENGELDLEWAERQMEAFPVKLLAVCHVSNVTGTCNPVEEICALAGRWGVPVLVDGAQGVRHEVVDVRAMGCDFYCFSAHKLFGPTGIGVLYGNKRWLERWEPVRFGGGMVRDLAGGRGDYEGLPLRFEAGTPNLMGAVGLHRALDYLKAQGAEQLRERERMLTEYLETGLRGVDEVKILGRPKRRLGMVSFVCGGVSPLDTALLLDKLGIAVRSGAHCALPQMESLGIEGAVRVSPAFYNTREEIDRFLQGLRNVLCALR